MKKLLAFKLLLSLVLFSIPASLSANPATAINKLISKWFNENKKEWSQEMKTCHKNRQNQLADRDANSGSFDGSDEEYLDMLSSRAITYCEAVIPEKRRYKQTDK
jgi:hypothetical protein